MSPWKEEIRKSKMKKDGGATMHLSTRQRNNFSPLFSLCKDDSSVSNYHRELFNAALNILSQKKEEEEKKKESSVFEVAIAWK